MKTDCANETFWSYFVVKLNVHLFKIFEPNKLVSLRGGKEGIALILHYLFITTHQHPLTNWLNLKCGLEKN